MGVVEGVENSEGVVTVEFVLLGVVVLAKAVLLVVVLVAVVEGVEKLNPEAGVAAGGVATAAAGVPKVGVAAAVGNTVVGPHEIFDML